MTGCRPSWTACLKLIDSYKRKTIISNAYMDCLNVISKTAGAIARCGCEKGVN
jgi:hypothetical protein